MKKSTKTYLLSWVVVLISFVLLIVAVRADWLSPHHRLAKDPKNIERITGIDLPASISVDSDDNLDRGASCWDCFSHRTYFKEKLSEDCIQQLENLCLTDTAYWQKNENAYEYHDSGDLYFVSCYIYDDYSHVEYYIDEYEPLFKFLLGFFVLCLAGLVLIVIGIILLFKGLAHRWKSKF